MRDEVFQPAVKPTAALPCLTTTLLELCQFAFSIATPSEQKIRHQWVGKGVNIGLLECGSGRVIVYLKNVGVTQGYTLQDYNVSSTSVCTHTCRVTEEKNTSATLLPKAFSNTKVHLQPYFPKIWDTI